MRSILLVLMCIAIAGAASAVLASGDDGVHEHEHSADHDSAEWSGFLGRFHPLAVHFPIALLLVAALAEAIFAFSAKPLYGQAGQFCLLLGFAGAAVAVPLGWMSASGASYSGDLEGPFLIHRATGTAVLVGSAICVYVGNLIRTRDSRALRWTYRAVLLATITLVSVAGHFGAALVYGADYFSP